MPPNVRSHLPHVGRPVESHTGTHARRWFRLRICHTGLVSSFSVLADGKAKAGLRSSIALVLFALVLLLAACTSGEADSQAEDAEPQLLEPAEAEEFADADPLDISDITGEPTAPSGLRIVSTTEGTIEIAWDESREDGVSSYLIIRSGVGGASSRIDVTGNSYTDSGHEDGDVFSYRVVAIRDGLESAPSETVTAQVGVDTNPPRRPGRPEITEEAGAQTLVWTSTDDVSGIANYVLIREVDGVVTEIEVPGTETSYSDDLPAGTVATYAVVAVDGGGNVSEPSRNTTLLTGTAADRVVVVVSAQAEAGATTETARLERELLEAGYTISWFEDEFFDSNVTTGEDIVLLLGDVAGDGFDWNVFATDATVIGLKASFIQAGGFLDTPPKLDRVAQVTYDSPDDPARVVSLTTTTRPLPVVYLPANEQLPDLDVWAYPAWSDTIAVAGIIEQGGELATGRLATGCRAFFPGNTGSLAETSTAGWELLIEFVGDVEATCG